MSDRPPLEEFLKWELRIESPSLAYAAKAATRNVILAVDIPYPLLIAWYNFIAKQKKERGKDKSNNTGKASSCSTPTENQELEVKEL